MSMIYARAKQVAYGLLAVYAGGVVGSLLGMGWKMEARMYNPIVQIASVVSGGSITPGANLVLLGMVVGVVMCARRRKPALVYALLCVGSAIVAIWIARVWMVR